jgi:metal-responsive CopG/Arc/MetJ family transcriptional regulator
MWNRLNTMETIQVVLDSALLRAADGAAKRARINRSALIRNALRLHLAQLRTRELEARDREGYLRHPEASNSVWEQAASWPLD